ncbi:MULTISPECIES: HlyD family secretion protein [unclassified Arenibacter]|jgi:HlyD family secretion protein|uniref:HlyD family secretion protein n=1 Tax=unclassified Arenibacter TaxID=2615047 RepID=UPI000E34497E|nr:MULTISPECIES: HlyD family efflux transporter periplasmic adaptor subunit [unclassified Arenibacter]MCM4165435.1 HlyD family secretion protein [Arenibacter sp. A80]RFT54905.1 HlyD family efflux transporter periplasmic adaptor subunit [Arenibacter sp. P308M17]
MKHPYLILTSLLISILGSCTGSGDKADGYGNFEATEITISAEANGKILFLDAEEGNLLAQNKVVGVIDTVQLSLKRDQLLASKNTIFSKSRNVLSQREVLKEQLKVVQNDRTRIENLLQAKAATTKQLDDINGQINIIKEQIKSVETQNSPIINEIKSIEIQIRQIEDQINKSVIQNPVKGTVLVKYAEPNEITAFGKPLYKIANLEDMILRVYISENQLSKLKIGQEVSVKIDAGEEMKSYPGVVSWIAESAEFTPKIIQTKEERVNLVYAVKVKVRNDGSLKIGMPAEMWIVTKTNEE